MSKFGESGLSITLHTFSTKSSNTVIPSLNNRNSLGYDSGHDSGIGMVATVDSPEHPLLRTSPYSKLTRPRIGNGGLSGAGHWSSSGHGSDNSSAVSSDFGFNRSYGGRRSENSNSKQISSDDQSSSVKILKYDDSAGLTVGNENFAMEVKSIDDSSKNDDRNLRSSIKLNKQAKHTKLGWLENMARNVIGKSNTGPQNSSILSPRHDSKLKFPIKKIFGQKPQIDKSQRSEIDRLYQMQNILKEELKNAKERLGVPANKWNYDLHISQYNNSLNQSDFLEALRQETKILEKRVAACKSHVMMVTVFDSTAGSRTVQ
uniref:Uncharacterized protein n=1 Tax=Romanomermis culicivorax TaxID=13658 RepID=A0A915KNB1_ROMCU